MIQKVVIILVTLHICQSVNELKATLKRNKRDDAPWIWGADENVTEPIIIRIRDEQSTAAPVTKAPVGGDLDEPNPCLPTPEPIKPNFEKPGRRISEAKCFDYIWQIKDREEKANKTLACFKYKIKHRGPLDPNYAIGGRDTSPGEFPHMGAIGWKAFSGTWIFKCGSTLISSKFVLTAAHCSKVSEKDSTVVDPVPKIVRLGDKNIADVVYNNILPKDVNISKIILHPQFNSPKKYYDIALMELEEEVTFTYLIQPACLWSEFDTSSLGTKATLTGWGVIETATLTTSPELKAAEVDVLDSRTCEERLRSSCSRLWCGMQDTQLCAGKLAGGVDACQGDSGGPLQVPIKLPVTSEGKIHYVIGVTSFGVGCARPNTPAVYTRVSAFVDWIEAVVWPRSEEREPSGNNNSEC